MLLGKATTVVPGMFRDETVVLGIRAGFLEEVLFGQGLGGQVEFGRAEMAGKISQEEAS